MNTTIKKTGFMQASTEPLKHIIQVSYEGQDPSRKMYKGGYEDFMNQMPVLRPDDENLTGKVKITCVLMGLLADRLKNEYWITNENIPITNGFNRTIIAMEPPFTLDEALLSEDPNDLPPLKEGTELVVAKWGNGHTSPVHGHAAGYLHEEILSGKMRVNTYRIVDQQQRIVRLVKTEIVTEGTFASMYNKPTETDRSSLVHNFTSIGNSVTLHYLPEHTRDGRDNRFDVQTWESSYFLTPSDVTRISAQEGMYLQKGEVVLVRSSNVPEYGDHYIVVTGHPVPKEHGLRVQDVALTAMGQHWLLDQYEGQELVLLKLSERAKRSFMEFHGIELKNNEVTFPQV